jgi:hypothetical protein
LVSTPEKTKFILLIYTQFVRKLLHRAQSATLTDSHN